MLVNNQKVWSSTINSHQFACRFVVDALGLNSLNNIKVAGDTLPILVDIGILLISKINNKTRKK